MKNEPKITIISGFYNRSNYVDDSIMSILHQEYSNFEFIVFDDSSQDDTYDKIKKYADQDKRIKLFRNPVNLGFVKSMNFYLENAEGDYIAVHGSGDISYPDRIAVQANFLQVYENIVVVSGKVKRVDIDGKVTYLDKGIGKITYADVFRENRFYHGEVMYRKDIFRKVGGYREIFKVAADYDLWLKMLKFGDGYIIDKNIYTCKTLTGGLSACKKARIQQKINVAYARVLNKHEIQIKNVDELSDVDISKDKDLKNDFMKLFFSCLKRNKYEDAKYILAKEKAIMGSNIGFSIRSYLLNLLMLLSF